MTETLPRREANKARTREAVVDALRALVEQRPVESVTVDQLAEAAGISRRTFFNYYAGIPAVLVEVFSGYAERMVALIPREALVADPLGAMRALVADGGMEAGFLGWMAALNRHDPGACTVVVEHAAWTDLGGWLDRRLRELFPAGTDPLYLTTLAASVMHAFAAAEREWLDTRTDPTALTPADHADFAVLLDRALSHLECGWRPD